MKTLLAAIATVAFATGATADSFYHGFAKGNPALYPHQATTDSVVAAQLGVGDSFDRYHGWEAGNEDLFGTPRNSGDEPFSKDPKIYGGFRGPSTTY